jgi:hypothetical protein
LERELKNLKREIEKEEEEEQKKQFREALERKK